MIYSSVLILDDMGANDSVQKVSNKHLLIVDISSQFLGFRVQVFTSPHYPLPHIHILQSLTKTVLRQNYPRSNCYQTSQCSPRRPLKQNFPSPNRRVHPHGRLPFNPRPTISHARPSTCTRTSRSRVYIRRPRISLPYSASS